MINAPEIRAVDQTKVSEPMSDDKWWSNTVKMVGLLREREAQRIANNIPLALGELSELIKARADLKANPAVYIAVPSQVMEEQVTEWAQSEWLKVSKEKNSAHTVLCISWGGVSPEIQTIDGRFLHDGKLVILKAH